jgi:hypothetical protein
MQLARGLDDGGRDVRALRHPTESARADCVRASDEAALLTAPPCPLSVRRPGERVRGSVEVKPDDSRTMPITPCHRVTSVERPAPEFKRDAGAKRSGAHDSPAAPPRLSAKHRETPALTHSVSEAEEGADAGIRRRDTTVFDRKVALRHRAACRRRDESPRETRQQLRGTRSAGHAAYLLSRRRP